MTFKSMIPRTTMYNIISEASNSKKMKVCHFTVIFIYIILQQIYAKIRLDFQINVLTLYKSYCSFVLPSDFKTLFFLDVVILV